MTEDELKILTETAERSKSNTKRIDKLENRQDNFDKLVTSVEVLAIKQESMERDVREIKSDVKSLTEIPARRWEAVIEKVILVIAGTLVSFLLAKAGIF